jgi:hypothetical protein
MFRILFVGAIDGGPELKFLAPIDKEQGPCEVHITSYQAASAELNNLADARTNIRGGVDATNLGKSFPDEKFDAVVWIGPTNDGNLAGTPDLVRDFVESAPAVLLPGGIVFVVQDLKTPNFRGILQIPGAYFCCAVSLEGRTQTQHSASKKVMTNRSDQLVAFTFQGGKTCDLKNRKNDGFVTLLTKIMAVKGKWQGRYTKKEIADRIFSYAENVPNFR